MNTTNRNSGAGLTPRHEPAPHKKNRPWAGWLRACAPGLFFLLAAAPAVQAGTLVVGGILDSGGAVVCGGNMDYPSISSATSDASDGDEIVVCPGTYNGQITLSRSLTIRGATSNRNDVIVSHNGMVFQTSTGAALTLKNMRIISSGTGPISLSPNADVPYTFENLYIENSSGTSVRIGRSSNVTMKNVEISSSSGYAVYLGAAANGDHLFEKVTASSSTDVVHVLGSKSVTMRGTELTSTAGHALYLGPSAIGDHRLENVKLKSTNATGVHMETSTLTPRSMTIRNVIASTQASTGIYILGASFIDIDGVTASSSASNAMYLRTNSTASGKITVKNGSLDAYANGMDIGNTSSAEISNVCVTRANIGSGIYSVLDAYNVTIKDSLFENFGYWGVNMHSSSSRPATVTNNIFLGKHPFAYSSSTNHNFDGNYWEGTPGNTIFTAGANAIDHNTLGAPPDPAPTCHTPAEQVHHFRIKYASEGLTCAPEEVTVTACANENCSELYTGGLTLTLSGQGATSVTPKGDISGGIGHFSVRRTTVGDVIFGIASSTPGAANSVICLKDSTVDPACTMNFVESALKFYHSDGTDVLPGLPNLISAKPSGPVYLRALKADPNNPRTCAPAITGTRKVGFHSCYVDPDANSITSTKQVYVNDSAVDKTCSADAWSELDLVFDQDAQAIIKLRYDDAGKMNLRARYQEEVGGEGEGAPTELLTLEASDSFIARPAGFCVERPDPLTNPDNLTGYCTATDKAACAPFIAAGDKFDLLVRAAAWESDADADFCTGNAVTPNYKTTPNYQAFDFKRLEQVLEAPLPGQTGDLKQISQTEDPGTVVKTLTLSEVGVFHFEVEHNYMGAGVVKGSSLPIGRFIPASFKLVPIQQAGCSIATTPFTYAGLAGAQPTDSPQKDGQPFEVSATIQALNRDGGITQNYYGDFMRLVPGSSTVPSSFTAAAIGSDDNVYSDGSLSAWNVTSLNMAEGTNPVTDLNAGTGDMAGQAKFIFNTLNAPADIAIRITATDTDGVTGEGASGLVQQRIGRLVVGSAHSHLEDVGLTIAAETQFYNGTGYELSSGDACTDIPANTIGLAGSLVGKTALDSTYVSTVSSGHLWLPFTAPGASGFVDATIFVPEWLRYDWDGNGIHDNNPMGRASWGLFRGSPNVIRLREVWN